MTKPFLQRTITAVFIVGIMTAGILSGGMTSWLLFLMIAGLCLTELKLLLIGNKLNWRAAMFIFTGLIPCLTGGFILYAPPAMAGYLTSIALTTLLALWVFIWILAELLFPEKKPYATVRKAFFGFFYIGLPFSILPFMVQIDGTYSAGLLFGFVALIWVFDSGSYVVGTTFGRTKIMPAVSPGKTWEGALGGLVLAMAISMLIYRVFDVLTEVDWLVVAVLTSVFGLLGDLVESSLKRHYQWKDSGSLLPGHGGMLDRFDSLIFAIPFTGAYLLFIA